MKLHNFEMIVAIICFFKHFQSLQSDYYIGIVRSLYEKLHITFFSDRIVVANALPEDLQILCEHGRSRRYSAHVERFSPISDTKFLLGLGKRWTGSLEL